MSSIIAVNEGQGGSTDAGGSASVQLGDAFSQMMQDIATPNLTQDNTPETITVQGTAPSSGEFTSLSSGTLGGLSQSTSASVLPGASYTVSYHAGQKTSSSGTSNNSPSSNSSTSPSSPSSSASPAVSASGWQPIVTESPDDAPSPGDGGTSSPNGAGGALGGVPNGGAVILDGTSGGGGVAETEVASSADRASAITNAVTALYQRMLGRPPDAGGLASYVQAVLIGSMTLQDVANSIAASPEADADLRTMISDVQGRQATSDDQPWLAEEKSELASGSTSLAQERQDLAQFSGEKAVLNGVYHDVLGRDVDPSGLATYEAALGSGSMTVAQVRQAVAQSPEMQDALKSIILEVQGRDATAADQPWQDVQVGALGSGSTTLTQIRQDLAAYAGESGVITGLYQDLVGRAPSAQEIAATEAQLAAGVSLQTIRAAGAQSPETLAKLKKIISDVQGRDATDTDQPWLDAQVSALADGGATVGQIRQSLATFSGESGVVDALYQNTVGRVPSAAEVAATEAQLASGVSLQTIQMADATSPEALQHEAGSISGQITLTNKGVTYALSAWHMQEVTYTKRSDASREALRATFRSTIRGAYLKNLARNDRAALETAGLSSEQIDRMAAGRNPRGYDVHHILPLDDGGTNDFSNLVLIQRSPVHYLLNAYQNSLTGGMQAGQTQTIDWPVPDQSTPILPVQGGAGAVPIAKPVEV